MVAKDIKKTQSLFQIIIKNKIYRKSIKDIEVQKR